MIIDAHTHMIHGRHLDALAHTGPWGAKEADEVRRIARSKPHYAELEPRIGQLDRNGIDLQVVVPPNYFDCNLAPGGAQAQLAVARLVNDNMARLTEESKGRLPAIGGVPLAGFEPGGRRELERALGTLGLKGVSISSNLNGKPLDLAEFEPFWAYVAEKAIPVYIHPHDPAGREGRAYEHEYDLIHNFGWPYETTLALARLVLSGTMERHPGLTVVAHHLGGGMIPFYLGRSTETYDPASQPRLIGRSLPRPLKEYFSRFYIDTAVGGSAAAIRCAYEVFGAERMLFATDSPWGPGTGEARLAGYPGVIRSLELPEEDTRRILSENARRLLKLD